MTKSADEMRRFDVGVYLVGLRLAFLLAGMRSLGHADGGCFPKAVTVANKSMAMGWRESGKVGAEREESPSHNFEVEGIPLGVIA